MQRYAAITGWGHYLPERVLTNRELEALVDTSDQWIRSRTGIRERRLAAPGETTASMCTAAARRALACAGLPADRLDLIVCATTTPDQPLPATGCLVQRRLGADRAGAFDVNAACTGFVYGLAAAAQFIRAGACDRALVVAGETLSRFLNWKDRNTCVLFGDGAGAVVLEAAEQDCGVLSAVLGSQGDAEHLLAIEAGGSARPASAETVARGEHYVTMRGSDVFKQAVRCMSRAAAEALARAGLAPADVHAVLAHQANLRILRATQESLGLPWERFFVNVDRCGNTGAASIPIALSEYLAAGAARAGDNLLLTTFGGGLTWASVVVRWADVAALVAARAAAGTPAERARAAVAATLAGAAIPA
jgi:3-oxoacyl-[acyl-carrier-protein] synthase-3